MVVLRNLRGMGVYKKASAWSLIYRISIHMEDLKVVQYIEK